VHLIPAVYMNVEVIELCCISSLMFWKVTKNYNIGVGLALHWTCGATFLVRCELVVHCG